MFTYTLTDKKPKSIFWEGERDTQKQAHVQGHSEQQPAARSLPSNGILYIDH